MKESTVTLWLAEIGKDRAWLAEQLKKSVGTINNWFSQGIPPGAEASIRLLMSEYDKPRSDQDSTVAISLSWDEIEMLHEAASKSGMGMREFLICAIRQYIQDVSEDGAE